MPNNTVFVEHRDYKGQPFSIDPNSVGGKLHSIMYAFGCPAHKELFHSIYVAEVGNLSLSTIEKKLNAMVKLDIIRRLRPGVYSARGAARD